MAEIFDFYVNDNRSITFKLSEPIMLEDNGVSDWRFHIPNIVNGLDATGWAWWLVYVNAKNEKYTIPLILEYDYDRPDAYSIATYTVDYGMSCKVGNIKFSLEAIDADTGGTILHEWHTKTYSTNVVDTLQGNQVEYAETESDIISALLIEVRNKVNQLVGGATPTPVSSVSEMLDTDKLYLLTTYGEWYFHNGTTWVSGGVYGAGVVDQVPTQGSTNAVSSGGVYDEITSLKEDLNDFNSRDVLSDYTPKASTTSNGVTYTWSGNTCHVSGTSTNISQHNIIAEPNGTGGLIKGRRYSVKYTGVDVMLVIYFYTQSNYGGTQTRYILYNDGAFVVPNDTQSVIVRLRVNSGKTVNENVSPHILNSVTNEELDIALNDLSDANKADIDDLKNMGTVSGNGNPLLLKESSNSFFKQLEVSGNGNNIIKCFGKNLARPLNMSVTTMTRNGVTFTFDHDEGSIRVQSDGASADTVSGNFTTTINGISNTFNYKLHAVESCYVTVSSNCKQPQAYVGDSGNVTMQVWHLLNGSNFAQRIKETNFTMHLSAGEDVGIRFYVREGWSGDLTFYPQIEIGTHATAFEPVSYEWTTGISNSVENAFVLTGATGEKTVNGTVTTIIDVENKALSLNVSNLSANQAIGNLSVSGYSYLTHLKFDKDTRIFMSGVPSDGSVKAIVFYIDENEQKEIERTDFGGGKFGTLLANVDYYYTLTVLAGADLDNFIVRPVISTGMYAIEAKDGITTLICDDDITITATVCKRNTKESAINGNALSNNFNALIGMRSEIALKRLKRATKPIITFTDDDTSSVALVTRYYNALHSVGAIGNYAVITDTMLANEGEKELLLSYEKQGFGCLYHCRAQGGAQASSPGACYLPQFRDMAAAEDNFVTGMRAMEESGFTAYKYWVAPYGVDDAEILTIPRRHGFNCLITMGQFGHISPANCDRWHIPRWHLSPAEFSARGLNSFKQVVDACVADYGWLIVVTHCNEWDDTTTMDTALANAAQYAKFAGMDIRNFPDAYELFKPFFYMNEMF